MIAYVEKAFVNAWEAITGLETVPLTRKRANEGEAVPHAVYDVDEINTVYTTAEGRMVFYNVKCRMNVYDGADGVIPFLNDIATIPDNFPVPDTSLALIDIRPMDTPNASDKQEERRAGGDVDQYQFSWHVIVQWS